MFRIEDLIAERQKYEFCKDHDPLKKDSWFYHIITEESRDEVAFITTEQAFLSENNKQVLMEKYQVVGIYMLGAFFPGSMVPFYIVHLSKKFPNELRFALFYGKCYDVRITNDDRNSFPSLPKSFTAEWKTYVGLLEQWMNGDVPPLSNEKYEFNVVSREKLYKDCLLPDVYSKEKIEVREIVASKDTKDLSTFADVLISHTCPDKKRKVKVLRPKDFNYPLEVSNIRLGQPTNIVLKRGDIIVPRSYFHGSKPYLFNCEGRLRIYAPMFCYVIRCKTILPEYLYLYLSSDIGAKVLKARYIGSLGKYIIKRDLEDFPVALPIHDEQKYVSDFNMLTSFGIRDYDHLRQFNAEYERIANSILDNKKNETVEDIINQEVAGRIKAYTEDQLRSFLIEDMKELNACFRAKAYKATLILAGSILEAVLIDWLSEIHGKNYFKKRFYIKDKDSGQSRHANLIDYIDEIKELKRPDWVEEAEKAHKIRENRNLVHAQLCMKADKKIDKDLCLEVISYLEDVLKTRCVVSNPRQEKRS